MPTEGQCPFEPELRRLLEEELSAAEEEKLAGHLRECSACRAALDELTHQDNLFADAVRQAAGNHASPEAELVQMIQRLRAQIPRENDEATTEMPVETGQAAAAASSQMSLEFLTPSSLPQSLGKLGQYDILGVIGSGGMGIVLRAQDAVLNRIVAIKVLRPELAANGASRQRFLREAQKAAAITHDHVVTIHAVGEANELPYIVMEYIVGVSLEERIRRTGPLKVEEILRIGMQSASGLAAAHAQGIVHRDVKPSNILLENGIERVKIADFGLARAADDAQITQTGVVAGTPEYMSPEQARDQVVDYRSDLFSLGAVLYAMCTGRSPFRASSMAAAIHRVCEDAPRPIAEVNRDIPDWLIAIIDRLLAKRPEERFESAARVAELLGDYLVHVQQPTQFPRPSLPTTKSPERRRFPIVKAACAAALAVVLLAVLWSVGNFSPIENGGTSPIAVVGPQPPAEDKTYLLVTMTNFARTEGPPRKRLIVHGNDRTETIRSFGEHKLGLVPGKYRIEVRDANTNELNRLEEVDLGGGEIRRVHVEEVSMHFPPLVRYHEPSEDLAYEPPSFCRFAISGDGMLLAVPSTKGVIHLWELRDGGWEQSGTLGGNGAQIRCVGFSPDGSKLAAGGDNGTLVVYEIKSHRMIQSLVGHNRRVWWLGFSADTKILVTSGGHSEVFVWDLATAQPRVKLASDRMNCAAALCPKGATLAIGDPRGNITLWNVTDGQPIREIRGHTKHVRSLSFTPDGAKLLSTSSDATAKMWNVSDGQRLNTLGYHRSYVTAGTIDPSGKLAATACGDNAVRLWDAVSGRFIDEFRAHWGAVWDLKFSPGGESLMTLGSDGLVRFWNLAEILKISNGVGAVTIEGGPGAELEAIYFFDEPVLRDIAVSPDGSDAAIATSDKSDKLFLLSLPELQVRYTRTAPSESNMWGATFIDKKTLITAGRNQLGTWDVSSGNIRRTTHHGRDWAGFAVLGSNDSLALSHGERSVTVRSIETGDILQTLPHEEYGSSWHVASAPNASLLAALVERGRCITWNLADPDPVPVPLPQGDLEITAISFSPDGTLFASGHVDGTVTIWEVGTWRALHTLAGIVGQVRDIAFSSDGRMLVAGGGKGNFHQGAEVDPERWDGRAVIWEVRTGRQLTTIHAHLGNTNKVAFTPDGTRLLTLGDPKMLKLWDIRALLEQLSPEEADAEDQ